MAPVLEVDVDALNADGGRLESLGHPFKQSNCAPRQVLTRCRLARRGR